MAIVAMTMPDLSAVSGSVKVLRWLVDVGRPVRRGEPLLEVETDKATLTVESAVTGTLAAIHAEAGQEVPAGEAIATFERGEIAGAGEEEITPAPAAEAVPSLPPPVRSPASPAPAGGSFFARNRQAARPGAPDIPQPGGGDA